MIMKFFITLNIIKENSLRCDKLRKFIKVINCE